MIPDFPQEKARIMEALSRRLQQRHWSLLGPFSSTSSYVHHEGHQWEIRRLDGSVQRQSYMKVGGEFSVTVDEVPEMTVDTLFERLDQIAETSAQQVSKAIFAEINKAVDEAGTGIDAGGRPLDQDLFLQGLGSIDWDFDEAGQPTNIAIVMHPNAWESHKHAMKSWEQDPLFIAKYNELVERKRAEWNARESRRRLVD